MSRHPFDLLMELRTSLIRLDCAALQLVRDEYPTLNLRRYLSKLDTLADEVGALRPGLSATLRYQALRSVLVDQHGLTGNHADYYHPDNSFLNRVLDTGRGIPISLSIIWIEVARRLKWPAGGVAFPGHFLVRIDDPERLVLADPFHDGRSLSVQDCRNMLAQHYGKRMNFDLNLFRSIGTRRIILRLLKNLRNIYLANDDLTRVARTLRHMAAVDPRNGQHLQELAAVCCRRGDVRGACAHLELYLRRVPNSPDVGIVQRNLRQLHAALIALN